MGLSYRLPWAMPAAIVYVLGLYYCVADGWRYVVDWRFLFGHGYVFFPFTLVFFGAYGVLLVAKYGRRGFFLSVLFGITCDIAMQFLSVYPGSPVWAAFFSQDMIEPAFWGSAIVLAYLGSRPLGVNVSNRWVVGMLASWMLMVQLVPWFGGLFKPFLEPATEFGWIAATFKSVTPE